MDDVSRRKNIDFARPAGYTIGMKVAVSIPDEVFEEADLLAKQLNTSRSEIYSRALARYVGEHAPDRVTQAINEVVDAMGEDRDEFVGEASRRLLERVEW